MTAKRGSLLSPKVRLLLEKALLEALRRYIDRKRTPARRKKAGKKKVAKKKPIRRRKRRA